MKKNTKLFLSSLVSRKGLPLFLLSVVLLLTMIVSLVYIGWQLAQSQRTTSLGNDLQVLSQQVPLEASQSINSTDYRGIPGLLAEIEGKVEALKPTGLIEKAKFIPHTSREDIQVVQDILQEREQDIY